MQCFILVSKDMAKELGHKFYFSGTVCARGNQWLRRTSTSNCVCPDCTYLKNKRNNDYYHIAKHDPEFQERIIEQTRKRREWKRKYDIAYRERTREKQNEWSRNWCKKNPDKRKAIVHNNKAMRRAATESGVNSSDLTAWTQTQKKVCYWCGKRCPKNYHIDHYKPLSKGGAHELDNLVIACKKCNLTKNAKDPYEFAAQVGRLL